MSVRGAVIHCRLCKFMTHQGRGRSGRVTDGGLWLPYRLVQLVDEVFEVLQATLADLSKVLPEGNLQLLLQVGVFSHQHLDYNAKRLTVLTVHLLYLLGFGCDGQGSLLLKIFCGALALLHHRGDQGLLFLYLWRMVLLLVRRRTVWRAFS